MIYYLSLGSNSGDRRHNMKEALKFLNTVGNVQKESALYSTTPVGMPAGTRMFLNQAIALESNDEPAALLKKIKAFERRMGRDLERSHYADRTIDIDILLAGQVVLDSRELAIPHPQMANRAFVLAPLAEIAANACHPVMNKTIHLLLSQLQTTEIVKKI